MKFSVIIPMHNAADYVAQTIQSVLAQNYHDLEIIAVDNASLDGTAEIVSNFDRPEIILVSEPDRGQLDAVQKGMRIATGSILHWLNADDIMMPGTLKYLADVFASNPGAEIVYSDNFAFETSSRTLSVGRTIRGLSYYDHLVFYRQMYSECVFWRRSALRFLPDHYLKLRVYTDYAYFLNLRRGRAVYWVPKRLGAFRIVPGQASERFSSKKAEEFRWIREQAFARLPWSRLGRLTFQAGFAPVFAPRQIFYPIAQAAVRRLRRVITKDRDRKLASAAFFDDWLQRFQSNESLERRLWR